MGKGLVWQVGDESDELTREVFARFGMASYHAQVLEAGMIQALVVLRMLPKMKTFVDRPEWEQAFDPFTSSKERDTFGTLASALRSHRKIPPELSEALITTNADRNRLAHGYFYANFETFMSSAGKASMLVDLEHCATRFMNADDLLTAWTEPLGERYGLDPAKIDADVEALIALHRER